MSVIPDLPAGFVDPRDPQQVAAVIASTRAGLGLDGVAELLARVPGLLVEPGREGGFMRRPVPPRVLAGSEIVVLGEPSSREHVVGGIVLQRSTLRPVELPGVLAQLCVTAVQASGAVGDASVALTAARDAANLSG